MTKQKFYVVWEGRTKGVFRTWADCQKSIHGFAGAKYKSYEDYSTAMAAFKDHPAKHIYKSATSGGSTTSKPKKNVGSPVKDAICVDAACSGNPGLMEYRGVDFAAREEVFHKGPYEEGTNNIGEFLAIVHALALYSEKEPNKTIYSDSKIAIGWIDKGKCGTKLLPSKKNAQLFDLIARAERWLSQHVWHNPIEKWETKVWGEIPADFGRKG